MQFLAISGSLRAASTNSSLLRAAAVLAPEDVTVNFYDELGSLPHFNPDMDNAPPPNSVARFRQQLRSAAGVIISTPEYAHGVPGALKNALDWLVASETFAGKPTMLINTSPRAFHAQASLREILSTMAARLIPEAFASISLTGTAATADDILADPVCAQRLKESLEALIAAIRAG